MKTDLQHLEGFLSIKKMEINDFGKEHLILYGLNLRASSAVAASLLH